MPMKKPPAPATMPERLKAVRAELKLSQREFAKNIYVSSSQYAELELAKRTINERIIHLISVVYNVNKKYLKDAKLPMFNTNPPDTKLTELLNIFDSLDDLLQDYLLLQAREISKIQKNVVMKK
jgi:transcriptional regulator with XRE-family HTH domain